MSFLVGVLTGVLLVMGWASFYVCTTMKRPDPAIPASLAQKTLSAWKTVKMDESLYFLDGRDRITINAWPFHRTRKQVCVAGIY